MSDIKDGLKKLIESKITRDFEGYPVGISDIGLADQIISYLKSQIEQGKRIPPYNLDDRDDVLRSIGYAEATQDILNKLQ